MRILSLLTGGIDLPKLEQRVLHLDAQHSTTMHLVSDARGELFRARGIVPNEDRQFGDPYETRYESLSDRLDAIENLIASRALAEDVETLRLKLNRLDGEIGNCTFGPQPISDDSFPRYGLSGAVAALSETVRGEANSINALSATVAGLSAKVEALTAAKLSEVKARKAPAKK